MKLGDALDLVRKSKEGTKRREVFLICGFQPLHSETFLHAHIARRFPGTVVHIQTGLYGDVEGSIVRASTSNAEAAAVMMEWADLDPRLGLRSAGGWSLSLQPDIALSCEHKLARLTSALIGLRAKMPVALAPPVLPPTPLGHTAGWQASPVELQLQKILTSALADLANHGVAVLALTPQPAALDAAMELRAGFPYTMDHASAVAERLTKTLYPPSPKKGLITDLDNTFWAGIVGEIGPEEVSWSLAAHAQAHGLYQQMLRHLSEMGVLIAVASKNDQSVAETALKRRDLLIPAEALFPVIANWGPKSKSVSEILRIWNIGADSVVMVDDSPMELEEVRSSFPEMTALHFPKQPSKLWDLLGQLRDLFGKPSIQREDSLRGASIRATAELESAAKHGSAREFLHGLQGRVVFDNHKDPSNKRLLELINKTNQFNLNGERLSEGEWLRHLADPSSLVASVSYEDKFGPLGVIGVVAGRQIGTTLDISTWVLSCRAFSRQIEHHTIKHLFMETGAETISLRLHPTERNEPAQQFARLVAQSAENGTPVINRDDFLKNFADLPHQTEVHAPRGQG